MAVRETMENLIARVRRVLDDAVEGDQTLTDDAIQEALDRSRTEYRYASLIPVDTRQPGGSIVYLSYKTPQGIGDWEEDAVITDPTNATITGTTSIDYINGRWTWATHKEAPLYITGFSYDLNMAISDCLYEWASKAKEDIDTTQQGVTHRRGQRPINIRELAREYAAKRKPRHIQMYDSGVSEHYGGGWS